MIFGQDRGELRRMYRDAWNKHGANEPLSTLETQIVDVVSLHPEYHHSVAEADLDEDYSVDDGKTNPFLHMGLHLGIREQIATNRPGGITDIYQRLTSRRGDAHAAEHEMIDCLAETLWEAQRRGSAPDERAYIERLRRLLG